MPVAILPAWVCVCVLLETEAVTDEDQCATGALQQTLSWLLDVANLSQRNVISLPERFHRYIMIAAVYDHDEYQASDISFCFVADC